MCAQLSGGLRVEGFILGTALDRSRTGNDVSCVTSIILAFHFSWQEGLKLQYHFSWQVQYLVTLACRCCNMNLVAPRIVLEVLYVMSTEWYVQLYSGANLSVYYKVVQS